MRIMNFCFLLFKTRHFSVQFAENLVEKKKDFTEVVAMSPLPPPVIYCFGIPVLHICMNDIVKCRGIVRNAVKLCVVS